MNANLGKISQRTLHPRNCGADETTFGLSDR
jgi:hypothetical protein